jgi:hypothetical protein
MPKTLIGSKFIADKKGEDVGTEGAREQELNS